MLLGVRISPSLPTFLVEDVLSCHWASIQPTRSPRTKYFGEGAIRDHVTIVVLC